jgi:ATP-dependent RNA/DNA helicase IGHMBP2
MIKMYQDKVSRLLNIQYRMNEKIMRYSSNSLYKGKLMAHDSVKNHLLKDFFFQEKFLNDNFNNENENNEENDELNLCENSLVYIDTSNYRFFETTDIDSSSRYNIAEAKICKNMVDYLKKIKKIEEKFIGIITPYSAQVNYLRGIIPLENYPDIEISTVDGFQGREKEIIILNLVRSNKNKEVGFLADKRRLNVAITRAKRMCILICDSSTVKKDNFIKGLCEHFSQEALLIDINTNIFDYKEIEDLQLECDLLSEKNSKEKKKAEEEGELLRLKQKGEDKENKKDKKKRNKKRKNNDNENNNNNTYNELDLNTISNNIQDIMNIINNNKNNYNIKNFDNFIDNEIPLNKELIDKFNSIVDDFISSENKEKKLEGLNNLERRYVHSYCEDKNIIHESTVREYYLNKL